jgi:hypothetical protein
MNRPDALVSPRFFLEERDIADLVTEFGPYAGRYVYEYPSSWKQDFLLAIEYLPPVEKKRAKEWMSRRITQTLLATNAAYDLKKTWASNVKSCSLHPPEGIKVGDAEEPEDCNTWKEALPKIRETSRQNFLMAATCRNYLDELSPLLNISPACYLIDQYLNPLRADAIVFIQSLLDRIKGGRCRAVVIITRHPGAYSTVNGGSDRSQSDSLEDNLRRTYQGLLRSGQELIVLIVENDRHGGRYLHMHPRYFLTKYGGLKFDTGFKFNVGTASEVHDPELIEVGSVGQSLHKQLYDQYINGVVRHGEKVGLLPSSKPAKSVDRIVIAR